MPTDTIGNNTGNTYSGTDDAGLQEEAPTTNFGADGTLDIHKYGSGNHKHAILKFTGLSSITGPVTVSAATLYFNQSVVGHGGGYILTLRRVLRNWAESEATWNTVKTTGGTLVWTTAGGESNGNDRSSTITGTSTYPGDVGYQSFASAQLIADVQDMINSPSSNFGWHIERTDGADDSLYATFVSSEGTDTLRPYLDITYTSGGGSLAATITSPTSSATYNNGPTSTITLGGTTTAATSVTWANDRGGSGSATNTGTSFSTWSISSIALQLGANVITVTAGDGSTTVTDTITVTYTATPTNARGFSTGYGTTTTDKIVSALTAHATLRTYAFWLYHHGGTNNRIFAKQNNGGTQIEHFLVNSTTVYRYLRSWSGGDNTWDVTFGAVPVDSWHHWSITYDAGNVNNDPLIYYDGVSQTVTQSAGPTSGTVSTNTDPYHLGNRGAGDRVMNGMMQDFAIWNRILSAAEILDLATGAGGYNGKSPLYYPTSLAEYIKLNDNPVTSSVLANPTVTGALQLTGLAIDFPSTGQPAGRRQLKSSPGHRQAFTM